MADATIIEINSEDEAWALLQKALERRPVRQPQLAILRTPTLFEFQNWPRLDVHLPKTPQRASISPTMMEAFIDLQSTIYRAHAFLSSGKGDLRLLTDLEKEQLEFRVEVKGGSSDYKIDLTDIVKTLGHDIIDKMDGTDLTILILGIALIVASATSLNSFLTKKAETRKNELENEQKKEWLQSYVELLNHDTKRYELLVRAIERAPVLGEIEAAAEDAKFKLVKAIGDERGGEIMGVKIAPEFASEISAQKRQQSQEIKLAGTYRVAKVDTMAPDGFRVTLIDQGTDEEITAALRDALISGDDRDAIQQAEWNKQPLFVELTARKLRQKIVDAVVLNARPVNTERVR